MNSVIKIFTTLVFALIAYATAFPANDSLKNVFVKIKPGMGVIIRHRESMGNLIGHVPSMQIEVGRQTYGKDVWEQLYRYPEYGVGYYFADLGNPKLLGYVNAAYIYLNAPFFRKPDFSFNYHLAIGISYLSKKWDSQTNYENLAIGSHVNVYFNIDFNTSFKLSKKLELTTGLGACHYSNGAIKQPNLGLNVVNINAGLKYYFNEVKPDKIVQGISSEPKKNDFSVIVAGGIKTVPPLMGPYYFMSTISFYFARQTSYKHKFGFGTDMFYDASLYDEPSDSSKVYFEQVIRNGIFVSHEYLIKKIAIVIQLGAYTYTRFSPRFPLYTRLALRYNATPHLFANISLKAHLGVADFIEWGVGYRFSKK